MSQCNLGLSAQKAQTSILSEQNQQETKVCGSKTDGLIQELLQPQKASEKDIKEIYVTLEHFSPMPSIIVKR